MASNRLVGEVWLLVDNEPEYLTVGTFLAEKKTQPVSNLRCNVNKFGWRQNNAPGFKSVSCSRSSPISLESKYVST